MKEKDLISIVMPAYNCEHQVEKSIDSIINQSYKNWELIIINDGSTDNTFNIINKYKDNHKIKIISQNNSGPSEARNVGIKNANGKYLMFIDSDDYYAPDTIQTLYDNICDNDLVIGNYKYVYEDNFKNNVKYDNKIFKRNDFALMINILKNRSLLNMNWNKIYKLDLIKRNNIYFDKNFNIGEDIRFNYEYLKFVNKVSVINNVIYFYTYNPNGLTSRYSDSYYDRVVNLINYEINYYIDNNFELKYIGMNLVKSFFSINDIELCLQEKYTDLYKKVKSKNIIYIILRFNILHSNKRLLSCILKLGNLLKKIKRGNL